MKRFGMILGLLVAVVAATLFMKKENVAKTADFAVSVENQKVKKNEEFTVYVKVNSSVNLSKIDAYLEYDSSKLEFVDAEQSSVNGASGMLKIADTFETSVTKAEYAVKMRALEVGMSDIIVKELYLEDDTNSDIIEVNQTSAKITVIKNTDEASDAALSELIVFPGELNPTFESEVTAYEVTVDASVDELILSAVPAIEDSVVAIDQPETLRPGTNEVKITVTAPSGTVRIYSIIVHRLER